MRNWCCPNRFGTAFCRSLSASDPPARLLGGAAALLRVDAALLRALGGTGLLADLGFHQGGANQRRQPFERGAPVALLGALAHGLEQDAAVVDELLAGQAAQAIPDRGPERGVLRQQEAQLRGARHLVDVLAAGARGTDEPPLQFFVGNDQVRRDDQGGHCEECCTMISRCATGMVMPCSLNRRQIARFTSERTLFTPSCGSEIQNRSSSSMPLSLKCMRRDTGAGSRNTRAWPS